MNYYQRQTLKKQKEARRASIKGIIWAAIAGLAIGLPFLVSGWAQ